MHLYQWNLHSGCYWWFQSCRINLEIYRSVLCSQIPPNVWKLFGCLLIIHQNNNPNDLRSFSMWGGGILSISGVSQRISVWLRIHATCFPHSVKFELQGSVQLLLSLSIFIAVCLNSFILHRALSLFLHTHSNWHLIVVSIISKWTVQSTESEKENRKRVTVRILMVWTF